VLLISLVLLAVLSILGISAMQMSIRELKLASDLEDRDRSFHAAEAGINAAVTYMRSDSLVLAFSGEQITANFNRMSRNPLAKLGDDLPTVEIQVAGDRDGTCTRTEDASSDDLVGCGAFEVVSTHAPESDSVKGGARTTLAQGISQEVIRAN
jgi:Tfp pilus assembly protein PilX